ncbi:hypothetical protein BBJ29_001463 [Phytophthora kernoviae]|uniref:Lysosomal Pro-X carboxypeptidase n=1 Tax=Phytophthora kernoviae TaxID=325452 RepID=A0A421G8Q8_9STRA|nr:hypothetical protein BBJ29_001463 [Phytophthora kernoviae]
MMEKTPMLASSPSRRGNTQNSRVQLLLATVGLLAVPVILLANTYNRSNTVSNAVTSSATNNLFNDHKLQTENLDGTPTDLLSQCEEKFFTQTLDHFDVGAPIYQERYFVCDQHFRQGGVMFFYVGNEANVELYLNHTGLMWENAEEFGAMLVFAEHRYFGKSVPFGKEVMKHMQYLSTEQAIADYAVLITYLKGEYKRDVPVIGFGGSYGGMLGSWFRMKYPHIIDGVIAGSAPILSFLGDEVPLDKGSFERIVTFDASEEAGSSPNCVPNIRRTWSVMRKLGASEQGRQQLKSTLSLCDSVKIKSEEDISGVMDWAKGAYDYMGMGNYPYPSSYIMNGVSVLPAYPVRAACSYVANEFSADDDIGLLTAFSKSLGVYYNSTQDQQCFELSASNNESALDADFWDYIFCAEIYQPQAVDGVNDMFWPVPWNFTADNEHCKAEWGIELRPLWATTQYGGRKALKVASNIVFSNGNYDPWSGTGVLQNYSDSVVALTVEGGAHHLDLMFSNDLDTPSVLAVRKAEKEHMHKWAREFYEHKAAVAKKKMPEEEKSPILINVGGGASSRITYRDYSSPGKIVLLIGAVVTLALLLFNRQDVLAPTFGTSPKGIATYTSNADGTPTDLLSQCEEKFFTQTLDHFDVGAPIYQERYFVCDQHFRQGGVMFFYVGNEANVELYLNHTGLMWENAEEFGAMLVFAEHRYFGKSVPFGKEVMKHMQYLSTEQAIADYAVLITYLKGEYKRDVPVIGFGGSYGGMLGSWFRMKYPHIIDGVIAGSAPILSYFGDEVAHDLGGYSQVTTFDASPEAGSAENCVPNIRRVWPTMIELGKTHNGRRKLKEALALCEDTPLNTEADVEAIMSWAKDAFDSMAMGNYPYPSSYIMNGVSVLPAYPMRVACSHVQDTFPATEDGELTLLQAFSKAIGVYYNSSHDQECYELSAPSTEDAVDSNFWDYIYCAELYGPTTTDGVKDMFWNAPWNFTADNASCHEEWGIDARIAWPTIHYGGRRFLEVASNLVFSNGNYDPCSATGVLQSYSSSVVAVHIEGGAHHLDLMFRNALDPEPLKAARAIEKQHMHKWTREFYEHKASLAERS